MSWSRNQNNYACLQELCLTGMISEVSWTAWGFVKHLIPPDSQVEIDAKIVAGYFTSGKRVTEEDLTNTNTFSIVEA